MNIVGKLNVTILECKGLMDASTFGTMSPYIELRAGDEHFKTPVARDKGTNPKFNSSFIFNLDGREERIHFMVLASELGADPKIARLDVPITTLVGSNEPTWYELSNASNFRQQQGQILLKCYLEGQRLPYQQQSLQQPYQNTSFQQPYQQSMQPGIQPGQQIVCHPVTSACPVVQQHQHQEQQQFQQHQRFQSHSFLQSQMSPKTPACVLAGQPGIVVALRTAHGKYICADSDYRVVGDRGACGEWECWFMQSSSNQVSLRSAHGRYLHIDNSGRVSADQTNPMYFMLQTLSETTIALRSLANKYLCADSNLSLVCNRDSIGPWETFTVEFPLKGLVSFLGHHGSFLCCEPSGNVIANRNVAKEWETWTPISVGSNHYSFRSYHGKFLRVDGYSGRLIADRDDMRDAEVFRIGLGQKPGTIAFRTSSNSKFLCVEENGNTIANRDLIGPWEGFLVMFSSGGNLTSQISQFQHQQNMAGLNKLPTCVLRNQPGIVVSLRTQHGRYLCADSDHRVIGDRNSCGEWECWFMQCSSNQVSLRSAHGRYLHVDYSGRVFTDQSGPMFYMMQILSETTIALKSMANKYLCAEPNLSLVCNRDSIGPWETFTIEFPLKGSLQILGHHGCFLCSEPNGTVVANRPVAKECETWTPMYVGVNHYSFRSYHGKFLRVDGYSGRLYADRDDVRDAEVFRLGLGQKSGTIAFRTSSSSKFLCFEDNGNAVANRDVVGPWECFTFLMS